MSWGPLAQPSRSGNRLAAYRFRLMPFVVSVTVILLHTSVIGGVQSGWNVAVTVRLNSGLAVLDREVAGPR